MTTSPTRAAALALYTPPFRYEHHTDAERAEFEAWARSYGTWEVKRDDDLALGTAGYTDVVLTVAWHAVQAARRAPATPVPRFNHAAKRKLELLTGEGATITGYAFQSEGRRGSIDCHGFVYWWQDAAAPHPPENQTTFQTEVGAAPQPPEGLKRENPATKPEAAPDCLTCNDHGAVGNILNAEPCPDCTKKRGTGCSVSNGETQTAPVELPEPAGRIDDGRKPNDGDKFYTEQQVRELLAAHGIGARS